ncbi:MAG: HpsJ-like protein, cyanoexosortase A-associated [Cyanobacterium sp.]
MNRKKIFRTFSKIPRNFVRLFQKYPATERVIDKTLTKNMTGLLPILGYIMFVGGIVNYAHILYPIKLQNPVWELQTLSALVENSWGFLISLGFIITRYFKDNQTGSRYLDFFLIKLIRWLIFTMVVLFLLSTPLIFNNTNRITTITQNQINREAETRLGEISQLESNLQQTSDENQLRLIAQSIGLPMNTVATIPTSELTTQIQEQLTIVKSDIENNAQTTKSEETLRIRKNSVKTFITGLLISLAFIIIWWNIGKVTFYL